MVNYNCEKCSKTFTQKSHFNQHQKRKNTCEDDEKDTITSKIKMLVDKAVEEKLNSLIINKKLNENNVATIIPSLPIPIPPIQKMQASSSSSLQKPFLKWVGGKTQIIQEVLELFPKEMNNYHEPFLGGGSVLLALLTKKNEGLIKIKGNIYASDLNSNLIGLYKNIQSNVDLFINEVKNISSEFEKVMKEKGKVINRKPITLAEAFSSPESYYFWIRARFNAFSKEERTSIPASAMLLFMNKTCFRGVYREGPRGFNVPYGNYANPSILDEQHIRDISLLIKDVIFTINTFSNALNGITKDDFVYLDPPYAPENNKSFVAYNADGFNLDNHKTLFKLCGEMEAKKVKMLMSNASVDLVNESFPEPAFKKKIISCRRSINSKKPDARTNEVLITNN